MADSELEAFKSNIDLRQYAAAQGYQLDREEYWHGSAAMRSPAGDKIIIKRGTNGHYVTSPSGMIGITDRSSILSRTGNA